MPFRRFSNLGGKQSGGPWQTRERNSICERKDPLLLRFTARIIGSSANKVSSPHGLDVNYSLIIRLSGARVRNLPREIISNPRILGNERELRIRETYRAKGRSLAWIPAMILDEGNLVFLSWRASVDLTTELLEYKYRD